MSMWESNTWGSVGQTPSVYRYHEPTTQEPSRPLDPPAMPEPWPIADDDDDDWWPSEIDYDDDEPWPSEDNYDDDEDDD